MRTVEPAGDSQSWEARLAAVKDELASGQVNDLGDLMRLGNKLLTDAGIDIGARFDAVMEESRAPSVRQTDSRRNSMRANVLRAQGAYYVVSGLWAVVDRRGFETVTGPKVDYWLVRTVGLLAATIGSSLLAGTRRGHPSTETIVLGMAAGVSFTAVDLVYVARRRISRVYLGDAMMHGILASCALLAELSGRGADASRGVS